MRRPESLFSNSGDESNPSVSQERRAILMLGMHRSGTSALTAVLGMLGADQLFGVVLADQSRRFASSRQALKDSQAMESAIKVQEEENANLNKALATSRTELARAEQDSESLREQLAEIGKSLAAAEQQVLAHAQEVALKNLELDAAAHRIQALETSLSWRVTAPLRWLAKTARCFLHSVR